MFRKLYILPIALLLSCANDSEKETSESDQDNSKDTVEVVDQIEATVTIDKLFEDWNIAVQKADGWYYLEGADEYGVHIHETEEGGLGMITMADRVGLSVDLYVRIDDVADLGGGGFELNAFDIQTEQHYDWAGVYFEKHPEWNSRVIDLEGEFAEMVAWEAGDGVTAVRLYDETLDTNFLTGTLEWVDDFEEFE